MALPYTRVDLQHAKVFLLALFFVLLPLGYSPAKAQPAVTPKRVMVLYWDNKDYPGNIKFDESFKAWLASAAGGVEYYPEYMETTRFPGANQSFLHDYLKQKYAGRDIDVVVATAATPLNFLIQYRADLFPNSPIVFVADEPPRSDQLAAGPGITGIVFGSTRRQTLELALKLHPDTKHVFVISGTPERDKKFEILARQDLSSLENKVEINYLTDLPLKELIAKTSSLPANSVVLYLWQQAVDEQGKLLQYYEVLARIAPGSSAPIYGIVSLNIGQGIVGGYVLGPDQNGKKIAEIVGRILGGARAQDIAIEQTPSVPMFDWRQLKRWRISESSLPFGSDVRFRQFSFWEIYKWRVIAVISLLLVQTAFILGLLVERSRRQRAVTEQHRLNALADSTHRRLGEIVSNVHGIVWESLIDHVTRQRTTTFISDYVQEMLGYTAEEWLAQPPGFGARIMHDDDRDRALQESDEVVKSGRDGFSQFRWRTKDGRFVWTENYLSPIFDRDKRVIGLRGVAIDISDRKQAEETVRETKAKDKAILDAVPDLMFLHSRHGDYLDYHCKDVHDLFVPPEKFLGKNVRDVLPPQVAEKLVTGFERAQEGAEPYLFEYQLPINGGNRWYEARMVPSAGNILTVVRDITGRKQAEESLQRAEEKDRAILEAIPDLMFLQTRDGVYLDYHCSNPKDLLVPPEAFIGKNMHEVLPSELAEKFSHSFQSVVETRDVQLFEYELPLHGEPRWFEARIVSSGENILSFIRDITQRVVTEAAIKRSEAQLGAVIGSAMDGIITVDEHQRVMLFNESAERVFGWPAAEAIGQSLDQFIPARYREAHRQHLQDFGPEKKNRRMMGERGTELFGLRRSGEEFPMEASISQIELHGQRLYTVILRDVTERKLADAALKESEVNYRSIFNAANDAIFVHELETGAVLDVNQRMCEMYGYTVDEARQLTVADVSANEPPFTAKEAQELIQKAASGSRQLFDWYARKKSGELFWVEVSLRRVSLSGQECVLAVVRDITERKRAETQLADSHRHVTEILESIGDAFYSIDTNFRFTYVNRKTEEVWAMRRQDLIGRNFLEVFPQAIGTYSHQECMRAIKEGSPVNFEAVSPILNRWVETSVYPTPAGLSVYFRDVTERKRATDELRQSEERFGKAFRANPQPMSLTLLATGEYLDVNDSFLEVSGYDRNEVIGRTSFELKIWENPEARASFVNELRNRGSVVNLETKFRTKDGSMRTLLSSAEQLEIGGQQCLLVASSDITERMLAQQKLKESEERFRNMADNAPVMIWVADEQQNTTYLNKQYLDLTGRTLIQEVGFGWKDDIHPDDLVQTVEVYTAAFQARVTFELEVRILRADGDYRWIMVSGTPRFSPDRKFLGYIGTCVDITERKQSEQALRTAHEELHQLKNQLEAENVYLQEEIKVAHDFGEIVGESDELRYVLFKIGQVAPTDSTVLITGETGTGKELVARAIHGASARSNRPLVKVNCAALSPSLIESELFGHERGSFTGATARKIGRFELANGATIFLDEIGELPLELQVKLLRVIQEGEIERLGSSKTLNVDVRIIAATNRNLDKEVKNGAFREDLWYRLNVFPITVPPLRHRRDDIPLLVEHFVKKFAKKVGKAITSVSPATLKSLRDYEWPGNVRELANVIERATINTRGQVLRISEEFAKQSSDTTDSSGKTLEDLERDYIIRVLDETHWRIEGSRGAAQILGLNPSTLRTRMIKLGIHKQRNSFSKTAT